jgi:hypothetical protein
MTSQNTAPGQAGTPKLPAIDPLDMARNLARAVQRYAVMLDTDEPMRRLELDIAQVGERGHHAGQLAANLALVSIAADIRRVADVLTRADQTLDRLDTPEPPDADPLPFPMPGDPE